MGLHRLSTDTILVGLRRVGLVGLREALEKLDSRPEASPEGKAASPGKANEAADREIILDRLLETLRRRNYIPQDHDDAYRRALWREVLRHRGEDIRPFLEEIPVTVQGDDGEERRQLLEALQAVLEELELQPRLHLEPATAGAVPQVVIAGEPVFRGPPSRPHLRAALQRSISHW